MFDCYIGIDYSGAQAPVSRLRGLKVFAAGRNDPVVQIFPRDRRAQNWCRKEVYQYCREKVLSGERCIISIDHGFSFPYSYFQRHCLAGWDAFLTHFHDIWSTDRDHMYVDFIRQKNPPSGLSTELRLCEKWTAGAKSVFQFGMQGSVAKSTHSGIPWLIKLRDDKELAGVLHFWPFDGFNIPEGSSVIAESYPSLFRRRYPRQGRTVDEQDAFALGRWLKDMDSRGELLHYFNPPLTLPERRMAQLEGWILGVR
ncbi:MAG: hypothetical protein AAF384_18615 [Pseudomonadota bacterium]